MLTLNLVGAVLQSSTDEWMFLLVALIEDGSIIIEREKISLNLPKGLWLY
jgi:hypothetical protein